MSNALRNLAIVISIGINSPAIARTLVTSTTKNTSSLNKYIKERGYQNAQLNAVTKLFDNTNTGVWIYSELQGHDIEVLVPKALTSDDLMDLLLKVRTAKSLGAERITVVFEDQVDEIRFNQSSDTWIIEHIENLFTVAGANSIKEPLHRRRIARTFPSGKPTAKPKEIYIAGDSQHPSELMKDIASHLKVKVIDLNMSESLENTHILYMASSTPPVNKNFFQILKGVYELKQRGARVTLISPYLPYARSDKKDHKGVAVAGRLIADLIESVQTDSILFARAHAPQSEGFFSIPVFHVSGRETISRALAKQGVQLIVSPDAGFQKDATTYAVKLGLPVAVVNKQRDNETSETLLRDISGPPVTGLVVAIVDDETASGGTLAKVAAFLKKNGAAKVITSVTHLAGKAEKALVSPDIDAIVVTNTLPIDSKIIDKTIEHGNPTNMKLEVISIAPEIARSLQSLRNSILKHDPCNIIFK